MGPPLNTRCQMVYLLPDCSRNDATVTVYRRPVISKQSLLHTRARIFYRRRWFRTDRLLIPTNVLQFKIAVVCLSFGFLPTVT